MKNVYGLLLMMCLLAFAGCEGGGAEDVATPTTTTPTTTTPVVNVKSCDINMNSSSITSDVVRNVEVSKSVVVADDVYPHIQVWVTFTRSSGTLAGTVSTSYSKALSPDATSVVLNQLTTTNTNLVSYGYTLMYLLSGTEMNVNGTYLTKPEWWDNNYTVSVRYYTAADTYIEGKKDYVVTTAEYTAKFAAAGICLSTVQVRTGAPATWGDYGYYSYTSAQATKIAMDLTYGVIIPTK